MEHDMSTTKTVKRPKQLRGAKKRKFRQMVEGRLAEFGYSRSMYAWQESPARLLMCLNGSMRVFTIHAGMRLSALEFELGRLSAWAEILGLTPRQTPATDAPRANGAQVDLLDAIKARAPIHAAA
jgi:hypothetical protein